MGISSLAKQWAIIILVEGIPQKGTSGQNETLTAGLAAMFWPTL